MAKHAKNKDTSKMKLRKAIEKWTDDRCAEVLRYVELRDHPPKPSNKNSEQWEEDDEYDQFIDQK
jgi:hypothetical protein